MRNLPTAVLSACLIAAVSASAEINLEQPPTVPQSIPRADREKLESEGLRLTSVREQIENDVVTHNAACNNVDSDDTTKVNNCQNSRDNLRGEISKYKHDMAEFKCALTGLAVAANTAEIRQNQDALRKLGIGTTTEAFEEVQGATDKQLEEYKREMVVNTAGALFSGAIDWGKETGAGGLGSIGPAQAKHLRKVAEELGITNPDVLDGIIAVGNMKDKREGINKLLGLLQNGVEDGVAGKNVYESNQDPMIQASNQLAFGVVLVTQGAPEYAKSLAKQFPAFAVTATKQVSIESGLATAPAIATTIDNLVMLHHPREAIETLNDTMDKQLVAVSQLRTRMVDLVGQLKSQQTTLAACPAITPQPSVADNSIQDAHGQ